jgi:hypothetical protein
MSSGEAGKLAPELTKFDESIYRPEQMIRWDVLF